MHVHASKYVFDNACGNVYMCVMLFVCVYICNYVNVQFVWFFCICLLIFYFLSVCCLFHQSLLIIIIIIIIIVCYQQCIKGKRI